jgi:FKBP-type peptidyl-prolyl cis-trans isomerase 2
MLIKIGDFIELDYTGRIKDDKIVFDTTIEETAKASDIYSKKFNYKPVIICVGEKHLVKGLDDSLIGKNLGKYTIEVKAENAFGKKAADLLKLIPLRLFAKDEVKPYVGLEVNVDGTIGVVRNVSGGRIIVDFNHPLSGRDLVYDIDIKRVVLDNLEKVKAVLELLGIPFENIDVMDDKASITIKAKLPAEATKPLSDDIQRLTGLKSVEFMTETQAKKELKQEIKEEAMQEGKKEAKENIPAKPVKKQEKSL